MFPVLNGIDHVHLEVPNKQQAADWYCRNLGFHIVEHMLIWSQGESGPLTIEDTSGTIHLALFHKANYQRSTAIAFGTDGEGFIQWKQYLEAKEIVSRVADHKLSWSIYFDDLFGHNHEITTYDSDYVRKRLS